MRRLVTRRHWLCLRRFRRWRHIHLNGHYTFRGAGEVIDLDAIMAGLVGGDGIFWDSGLHPQITSLCQANETQRTAVENTSGTILSYNPRILHLETDDLLSYTVVVYSGAS